MNREIKFRAWVKERDYGGIIQDAYMAIQGSPDLETLQSFMHHYGDETILMQFTGLKDKNGVEIYEGDIVKYTQSERFGESVNQYTTMVKYYDYGFTPMKYHVDVEDGFYSCLISDIEVIGNIYANPEFLTPPSSTK